MAGHRRLAGVALVLLALAAWAGPAKATTSTGTLGARTGTYSETSMCPPGFTMFGLDVVFDDRGFLYGVDTECKDSSGSISGGGVIGPPSITELQYTVCGNDITAPLVPAVGIYGYSGDVVTAVGPRCAQFPPPPADGGLGGYPLGRASGPLDCPAGLVLVGLAGTWGDYLGTPDIYSLTGICDTGPVKQQQTITWTQQGPYVYGHPPVALTAKASSGLAVSYTLVSGPCSVGGSTLTINGAGSCVVNADQGGNANFLAASRVSQTIAISRAPTQLVVAKATYGLLSVTFSARLTSQVTGAGIPGQAMQFSASGRSLCQGTTNATGAASCTAAPALVIRLGPASYTATYAGNANYLGSTGTGAL